MKHWTPYFNEDVLKVALYKIRNYYDHKKHYQLIEYKIMRRIFTPDNEKENDGLSANKAAITRSNIHADKSHTDFGNRGFWGEIDPFSVRTSFFHGISPDISSFDLQSDSTLSNQTNYIPQFRYTSATFFSAE